MVRRFSHDARTIVIVGAQQLDRCPLSLDVRHTEDEMGKDSSA